LEAIRQQIYSLPPLSTWVPARPTFISNHNGVSTLQANRKHKRASILIVENKGRFRHVTAPQQVIDGWLAEDDEDWPRIESIRFY
jgi:hypothetical protein